MQSRLFVLASCVTFALATPAFASGSLGGALQGRQLGQKVFTQKVACPRCPYAGGLKTRDQVSAAIAQIEKGEIKMSGSERRAVIEFINRRFKRL